MLQPIVRLAIDVPTDPAKYERFEAALRVMHLFCPGYQSWMEGCEVTVFAETELQLQHWVTQLHALCNARAVCIEVDGVRYECTLDRHLRYLLRTLTQLSSD